MNKKEIAYDLIKRKLEKNVFMTYKEIADITGYHPKYLLKLKKEVIEGTISLVHQNKGKKPVNTISNEEREYIISLYKRSHASIRRFVRFYGKRSYSCIYNVLKEAGLIWIVLNDVIRLKKCFFFAIILLERMDEYGNVNSWWKD